MNDSKTPLHDRDALMAAVAGKYLLATTTADGRTVGEAIANTGSIHATLDDYEVLAGVREVPMAAFDQLDGQVTFASATEQARTMALAEAIRQSGHIDPLIVVEDGEGPYVLEGGHRFDALRLLGARSFPAKVVLDMASLVENGVHALEPPPNYGPCTYYGTIEAKESDRLLLEAMGVEVWRYDQNCGRFYVCYAPEVHAALQEHTNDFCVSATAVPRVAEVTVFSADLGAPAWLAARQALLEWRRVGAPDVLDYIYADEIAAIDAARHPSQSRNRPASSADNDRPSVC
ncbi:ParB N-terminal domain-containing protein [Cupriavidus sp. TMH.W2]|uniref:ParB N-terminal domain-containing protein n=1 Tax=Cupriavidus sp. TMH.W2 TaxID=3434465 RepID=UPI003D7736AA